MKSLIAFGSGAAVMYTLLCNRHRVTMTVDGEPVEAAAQAVPIARNPQIAPLADALSSGFDRLKSAVSQTFGAGKAGGCGCGG